MAGFDAVDTAEALFDKSVADEEEAKRKKDEGKDAGDAGDAGSGDAAGSEDDAGNGDAGSDSKDGSDDGADAGADDADDDGGSDADEGKAGDAADDKKDPDTDPAPAGQGDEPTPPLPPAAAAASADRPAGSDGELPDRSQYILDRLPDIEVRGKVGADGEVKSYKIKSYTQLPEGFQLADDVERAKFTASIAAQEQNAVKLDQEYAQKQNEKIVTDFRTREAVKIRADVEALQNEGLLPKFKGAPSDTTDPAVQRAEAVLKKFNEVNDAYSKEGVPYRISYRDAFRLLRADELEAAAKNDPAKDAAREDRRKVAAKIGASKGASSREEKGAKTPTNYGSMSAQDIAELHFDDL